MDKNAVTADLNDKFATQGIIFGIWERGDLPAAFIKNEYCSGIVTTYGAHVISYVPEGGEDVMMMSKESKFAPSGIRGGVPICWPWFGSLREPGHGVARLQYWDVVSTKREDDGSDTIEFKHYEGAPYDLEARFVVNFGKSLSMRLYTTNKSGAPEEFSEALHTYFKVGESSKITLSGFKNQRYLDAVGGKMTPNCVTDTDEFIITSEVDYVYDTENTVIITDPVMKRKIRIEKEGSKTTVLWNPWIDKAKAMSAFGDEEYHDMVCVEAANARNNSLTLADGETHCLAQIITVEKF